jgi:hypothetical protein
MQTWFCARRFLGRPADCGVIPGLKAVPAVPSVYMIIGLNFVIISSVGVATGYGLDGRGVGVRVPVKSRFSPLLVVQTGSGAHPASYSIGTGS